jgi:hypothetical protein
MVKYEIEGGIDFYEELYKSLDNKEDKNQKEDECLITDTPLTNHHVKLDCGHKFNYEPLYNDIVNHKKKYNTMERCVLKTFEIRCPYCRTVQKNLLPYHEDLGLNKVHGVNYIDELINLKETTYTNYSNTHWEKGVCCYNIYDDSQNIYIPCANTQVMMVNPTGKKYCYNHKYIAQKEYIAKKKIEIKEKQKEEKLKKKLVEKKEKDDLKEQMKKQKLEEKMKGMKDTVNKKMKVSKNLNENVIISTSDLLLQCNQILKTGQNKGTVCGCKVFKDNLCTRHYNLINKSGEKGENSVL